MINPSRTTRSAVALRSTVKSKDSWAWSRSRTRQRRRQALSRSLFSDSRTIRLVTVGLTGQKPSLEQVKASFFEIRPQAVLLKESDARASLDSSDCTRRTRRQYQITTPGPAPGITKSTRAWANEQASLNSRTIRLGVWLNRAQTNWTQSRQHPTFLPSQTSSRSSKTSSTRQPTQPVGAVLSHDPNQAEAQWSASPPVRASWYLSTDSLTSQWIFRPSRSS